MNRIYETHFGPEIETRAHLGCKTAWSNQGLIAYTVERMLNGQTFMEMHIKNSEVPWVEHIIQFPVGREVTALKWNNTGDKILVGDSHGRISMYTMVENSSTKWRQSLVIEDRCDPIIAVGWYHPGIKFEIHIDKVMTPPGSDPPSLKEKITREKFSPTLATRGGNAYEGVFALTKLGRFVTSLTESNEEPVWIKIGGMMNVKFCGYAYNADGKITVAMSSGLINENVRIVDVSIERVVNRREPRSRNTNQSLRLSHIVGNSLIIPKDQTLQEFGPYSYVSQLLFPHEEYADQILLCLGYSNDRKSCVSWWMKTRQHKVLPKFLGGGCNVVDWMQCKSTQLPRIFHLTSQNFPLLTKKITLSTFSCGDLLAATCLDGNLYLIQKLSLKRTLQIEPRKDLVHPGRATKEGQENMITYCSIAFSPSGCALLGLDNNSNLYVSQVNPWLEAELPVQMKEEAIQLFLEYSLLSDTDCWDARLLVQNHSMANALITKLKSSIAADPEFHVFNRRFDAECLLLWSLFPSYEPEYSSKMSTLLTTAVLELFISFLRPTGASLNEENFDLRERLSQIADSNENLDDLLNVMMNTFETNMRILQSVGHLIQWMATHIISQVTKLRSHSLTSTEISISRRILLIMKLWTTLHNNCSPLYTIKDVKCDPLSESYAILSKVAAAQQLGENIPMELYDSCELLKCRVSMGEVSMKKPHVTSLKGRTFQVGKSETKRSALMVVDTDFVRRTIVGREETRDLRHCSRSGAYTYNRQESLISGWDHRFLKRSMCGGLWTNISSSPVKKPFLQSSLSQEFL